MTKYLLASLLVCYSLISVYGQDQENHLRKKISLDIERTELKEVLPKIGETGNFQFSYNSTVIPGDSLVDVIASDKQVEEILRDLLGGDIRFKVLGNHIILLPEDGRQGKKGERDIQYTLSGYIYDALSGEIISRASIYDVDERLVSATNQEGFYSLQLPSDQEERLISYSKAGYNDTIIIIRPAEGSMVNISLDPKRVYPLEPLPPEDIHERTFVAALVPASAITASENIPVQEERFMQVSFLPFVGSNQDVSGLITNRVSLNILSGYSKGVNGVELGGFLNIVRNDVDGAQLSGFGNIVGKDTRGIQLAGFFNVNGGSFTGLQAAGFSNLVADTIRGVQLAGFINALRGPMYGPQVSGFANFTSQDVDGTQLAGFINVSLKDVKAAQVAGFANIAAGTTSGLQVSGFMNVAREVDGLQISLFNVSDTVKSGLPIGLFSFVLKGYHAIELTADEVFFANASFKTGVRKFYNIFTAGINNDGLHGGYGLGSQIRLGKQLDLSMDLTSSYILNVRNPGDYNGFLLRFTPKIDVKIFRYLTFTAGPTFNAFANLNNPAVDSPGLPLYFSYPLNSTDIEGVGLQSWIGFSAGFRF